MSKIIIILLSLICIKLNAETVYFYNLNVSDLKITQKKIEIPEENVESDIIINILVPCYEESSIGKIGTDEDCKDKLIVDNNLLEMLVNSGQDYSHNAIFTYHVTNIVNLFRNKEVLFDITGWNTSNIHNMNSAFQNSINFNQNISIWNYNNVVNMNHMLNGSRDFEVDLSSVCVPKIKKTPNHFHNGTKLKVENLPNFGSCI